MRGLGKATALQDLKELLSMKWTEEGANQLNQSLTIRLDVDSPLVKVGVGPAPEKLQDWIARFYPGCSAEKKAAVKKAIRHWDVIFGTSTDRATVTWDQAGTMVVAKDAWNKKGFPPVRTTALRIEVDLQPGFSGGILEWRVK